MRITNSMISRHSQTNINTTKGMVDTYNNQMTSQKKIAKPSDDPVIAIRSLRLRDSLNEVGQYTDKNIPDAQSWLEVTETSLTNMSKALEDIYNACVNSGGTLTTDDRNTLLKNLKALKEQLYAEGNSDYAGRTVFTGYKTNKSLTFNSDDKNQSYQIEQSFSVQDITNKNFFTHTLELPTDWENLKDGISLEDEMTQVTHERIRLAYSQNDAVLPELRVGDALITDYMAGVDYQMVDYDVFEAADFELPKNAVYFLRETGEFVLGEDVSNKIKADALTNPDLKLHATYEKTGFSSGEVRPEMYFNCVDKTKVGQEIIYTREEQDIAYTVSANQNLKINTQAGENGILSTAIARDVDELLDAITVAQNANDKVSKVTALKHNSQYADEKSQAILDQWLEAANKEKVYVEENLKKLFSNGITKFQDYKDVVEHAKTDVGSRSSRLELTKTRMETQKTTIQSLIKNNEDRNLSDILIDYKAAYNSYESSLQAASKVNDLSLLKYL